jgi:hypothetical protein
MGIARLSLAAAFLALAWASVALGTRPEWLLLPAVAFAATVWYHQRVRARRDLAQRAVNLYRTGLERLQEPGRHPGPDGARFSDPHHVYGADLDLFGKQGLFERLCTARTPMGEDTLARWLLAPAAIDVIRTRHACIGELRGRMDLREDLLTLGEAPRIALTAERITAWAGAPTLRTLRWLRAAALLTAVAAAAGAAVWAIWGLALPFLAVLVIEAGINHAYRGRVQGAVAAVEDAYEDLKLLSQLLQRIEREDFAAPPLRLLKEQLASRALPASTTLARLATVVNFVEARRNPFLAPLLLPLLYSIQTALAAERWRERHGHAVAAWLQVLGEVEALAAIAAYSCERPDDPFPEFLEGPATFVAGGLGHPLIAPRSRVRNDVELAGGVRVLLVSGSNMSGKSTLLRAIGMNTVLAMAGAPVCAARLRLTPLKVGASIRVNDSLYEGSSRFYAEITRLRQLFEPSDLPLLFLLDELLQGTNSRDRRIGAQGVLRALLERGAIGLVSTHDLALADGADPRGGALKNVHFEDQLADGVLSFDFKLRDGVVTRSNGIELMRAIGLDV